MTVPALRLLDLIYQLFSSSSTIIPQCPYSPLPDGDHTAALPIVPPFSFATLSLSPSVLPKRLCWNTSLTYSAHSFPLILAFCGDTSLRRVSTIVPSGTASKSCPGRRDNAHTSEFHGVLPNITHLNSLGDLVSPVFGSKNTSTSFQSVSVVVVFSHFVGMTFDSSICLPIALE